MVKARIVVNGAVWAGTGYRRHAWTHARHRGAAGIVRNLPDGRAELFYDGPDESMRALVSDLRDWSIGVRRINVYAEGRRGYRPPWKEYEGFEIDYGDMPPYEREMTKNREWLAIGLMRLTDDVRGMREDLGKIRWPAD